ncbi:MAG TPA: aldo/keto reductase [Burkholderiales bacterium]|nr:aldo/keto reductase [Burkholderiales bacterium]
MKTVRLPSGERVPAYGLGTWHMGDNAKIRNEEIATLRLGIDLGATLIDTAEMYGEGQAEILVGEAIAGRRDEVFIVSKVYPHNATRRGAVSACERSLRRLETDRIDLYLLHWRGSVPLAETMDAFVALQKAGKIRHYGVSNLDHADMQELWSLQAGRSTAINQVLYNLDRRGIEWDLVPWLRDGGIPIMAYSPIEQGRLTRNPLLIDFGRRYGMTAAQAALAWLLRNDDVIVIPKSAQRTRLKENIAACEIRLSAAQLAELEQLFPPPKRATPLAML